MRTDERTGEQIAMGVIESLDTIQGRMERDEKLLHTAHDLLVDYCYTNFTPRTGEEIQFPKEIKLVKDLLSLVIDDIVLECDILNEDKKDVELMQNKSGC